MYGINFRFPEAIPFGKVDSVHIFGGISVKLHIQIMTLFILRILYKGRLSNLTSHFCLTSGETTLVGYLRRLQFSLQSKCKRALKWEHEVRHVKIVHVTLENQKWL